MDPGRKETLIGIDIPHTGDHSLVEQSCLDRSSRFEE